MIKKDLVCYIETNEKDEFVKVNRLETEPGFFLLTLGANRMVVNGSELMEAINAIDFYSTMFDEELKRRTQAKTEPPKAMTVAPTTTTKRTKKVAKEDEGAIILEPSLRLGPTESELALERMTKHMQGDTLVLTEKK
jgi:hypothetical protein